MSGRIRVAPARARTCNGKVFASKAEMMRYAELAMLERAGKITDLELQPRYRLLDAFEHRGKKYRGIEYVADFRYTTTAGEEIVEDVKGMVTEIYRLKKKLLLHKYPHLNFQEVRA